MKQKLWFKLFVRITAIFVVFVLVVTLSNTAFLLPFFVRRQEGVLRDKADEVAALDLSDAEAVTALLTRLREQNSIEAEIYTAVGETLYTSFGSQMLDYYYLGNIKLHMYHKDLQAQSRRALSDGSVLETAVDPATDTEFLLLRRSLGNGMLTELRLQKQLLKTSAATASEFICYIAAACFVAAVLWMLLFSRKFSRPISEMSAITRDMAGLDFSRRLNVKGRDEVGELAASINHLSDELKRTLDDLQTSNAQLRGEIEAERQLDAMRRGFVANVSHELKTPISIIQGYAEGLKLNVNAAARDAYCDTIIDESARMNRLVLGLLQLSKYESGQIPLDRQVFDLSQLADGLCSRLLPGADAALRSELPHPLFVDADPGQIEQVLKSYLENALSHVDKGGAIILFAGSDAADEKVVRVCVHNTGSHVDEDEMPHLWQSFYRGDASHKRDQSRFGLGLSIVSAIVKLHGRTCGVYNTPTGVCFWFTIDRAPAPPDPDAPKTE